MLILLLIMCYLVIITDALLTFVSVLCRRLPYLCSNRKKKRECTRQVTFP